MLKIILGIFIFVLSSWARADLNLPTKMTANDRVQALRILGLGASSKLLSDPYPLGGYSGFEFGLAYESLPTEDVGQMGNRDSNAHSDFGYENFSIGKGVYNNLDAFVNFTPWGRSGGVSEYGGMVRWGFYEAKFFPLSYSALLHANVVNVSNDLVSQMMGIDLMAAINVNNFAVYFGAGRVRADGNFDARVTDTGVGVSETITETHTFVGASMKVEQLFIAGQIDRFNLPVYSAKLGLRY